ncbi:hypothetical protein IFT98_05990 [Pseudomonas sp. CFBP 8770]|uniref:hypothetical protein n=1 Tax=unclassified Pseudomonas TaxID=196821 RepID=UPI00177C5186|nr:MULTISPECIES: hypothetical protein [unclassified Pseudomonas]MBD8473405.1 hypothetical protein [Pseudomonas sp. CFBP 8773]MBD8646532.1 hypothetical protein [Pseudomonas sp. CFBP 8770]
MLFGLSTDQLIAVSSSVAAAVSALATLFTVLQVSENRKSSYRPEIIFVRTRFDSTRQAGADPHGMMTAEKISVDAYNIGLGSAKNIELSWSFPIPLALEKINALAAAGADLNHYSYEHGMVSSKGKHAAVSISLWRNQKVKKLDFALPASVDDQPLSIDIPPAYVMLWEPYVIGAVRIGKAELLADFPLLVCTITYQDVGGVKYKIKREFIFDIVSIDFAKGVEGLVFTTEK